MRIRSSPAAISSTATGRTAPPPRTPTTSTTSSSATSAWSSRTRPDRATPHAYRGLDGIPWWSEYAVTNLYHNFSMDSGLTGIGSFGNDYIAGGAGNDVIFGQLGNDVVQGDGSIDYISHPYLSSDWATTNNAVLGGGLGPNRPPPPCAAGTPT